MIWTKERVIGCIQEWAALRGDPPRIKDWKRTQYPYFPSAYTVIDRFGGFGNALEAAGFQRRPTGRPSQKVTKREFLHLAHAADVPYDVVSESMSDRSGSAWRKTAAIEALRNAPASPLRDLTYAILTGVKP